MEYKKNKKKFLAFKKEVALKAVSNKRLWRWNNIISTLFQSPVSSGNVPFIKIILKVQINYSSTTFSKNGALVQNGLNIYRGVARAKMKLFAEKVNSFKSLTIFAQNLHLRCLIGSSYASDLEISSTCIFIHYSARLLEFVLFV